MHSTEVAVVLKNTGVPEMLDESLKVSAFKRLCAHELFVGLKAIFVPEMTAGWSKELVEIGKDCVPQINV